MQEEWLEALKKQGFDVAGAEEAINRLQASHEAKRNNIARQVALIFPDDIKQLIGGNDTLTLAVMYRGIDRGKFAKRRYMDGSCVVIRQGEKVDRDWYQNPAFHFGSSSFQSVVEDVERDSFIDEEGKSWRRSLVTFGPDIVRLADHVVCRRCGRRDTLGQSSSTPATVWPFSPTLEACSSAEEFWEKIRRLIGQPFERLTHPDEMPDGCKSCDANYAMLLSNAREHRRSLWAFKNRVEEGATAKTFSEENEGEEIDEDVLLETYDYAIHGDRTYGGSKLTRIYLMFNKRNGYFKIGESRTPKYRERTLQAEDPDVELVWSIGGVLQDEKRLQRIFNAKRVRGEWFSLSEEDVNWITSIKRRRDLYRGNEEDDSFRDYPDWPYYENLSPDE